MNTNHKLYNFCVYNSVLNAPHQEIINNFKVTVKLHNQKNISCFCYSFLVGIFISKFLINFIDIFLNTLLNQITC